MLCLQENQWTNCSQNEASLHCQPVCRMISGTVCLQNDHWYIDVVYACRLSGLVFTGLSLNCVMFAGGSVYMIYIGWSLILVFVFAGGSVDSCVYGWSLNCVVFAGGSVDSCVYWRITELCCVCRRISGLLCLLEDHWTVLCLQEDQWAGGYPHTAGRRHQE